jgi:hypothetical protein
MLKMIATVETLALLGALFEASAIVVASKKGISMGSVLV